MTDFHLVIVASGNGTRLAPMTNYIPKFLVNIGKNAGYVEQLRYWTKYTKNPITIIVHSRYAELTKAYHDIYFKDVDLIIKTVDVANGSAHAILTSCDHLSGESVMFSWCDVLPVDPLPNLAGKANIIFTNYNNSNRYGLIDGEDGVKPALIADETGGCFGLYFIRRYSSWSKLKEFKPGQDFIELIPQYGEIVERRLESIIDFGDAPKLIRTRAKSDEAREFNSIQFIDDYVLKSALNDQGKQIIQREIEWHEKVTELNFGNIDLPIPKTWVSPCKTSFFMSRAKGIPIWKAWSALSEVDRHFVLKQVLAGREQLFNLSTFTPPRSQVYNDIRIEAHKKLNDRLNEIQGVIDAFGPVRVVNGVELKEPNIRATIDILTAEILKHYRTSMVLPEYGFIHGDLQFSNSLIDLETRKVTIIDPRGYFGTTKGFGLADYDLGKLLYSLSGYDLFNYSTSFGIAKLEGGEIEFTIPRLDTLGIDDLIFSEFEPIHYLWLAVIWIGLAGYIKNDPVKAIAALYHGAQLAEQVLN